MSKRKQDVYSSLRSINEIPVSLLLLVCLSFLQSQFDRNHGKTQPNSCLFPVKATRTASLLQETKLRSLFAMISIDDFAKDGGSHCTQCMIGIFPPSNT